MTMYQHNGQRYRHITPCDPVLDSDLDRAVYTNDHARDDSPHTHSTSKDTHFMLRTRPRYITAGVATAMITASVCAAQPALAQPLPQQAHNTVTYDVIIDDDASTTAQWVLSHPATQTHIDLSSITEDEKFADVDVDAVLFDLSGVIASAQTSMALHTVPEGTDMSGYMNAHDILTEQQRANDPEPAEAVVAAMGNVQDMSSGSSYNASTGNAIVDAAASMIGTPYVWGGTTPAGFDCSGLVQWAHAQAGKSIPRTSYQQAAAGTPVSRADMQPGDVIVYYSGASHVAIYAGDGMMIDALGSGYPVDYRPVDYMPIHSIVRF